jgi:hypothetical protein
MKRGDLFVFRHPTWIYFDRKEHKENLFFENIDECLIFLRKSAVTTQTCDEIEFLCSLGVATFYDYHEGRRARSGASVMTFRRLK